MKQKQFQNLTEEQKKELIRQWMSMLAKKSVESRRHKYGAEGFSVFMKKISKKGVASRKQKSLEK